MLRARALKREFFPLRGGRGGGARDSAVRGRKGRWGKLGLGVAWVKLAWGWRPQQVLLPGAWEMQMIGTIGPLSPGHLW